MAIMNEKLHSELIEAYAELDKLGIVPPKKFIFASAVDDHNQYGEDDEFPHDELRIEVFARPFNVVFHPDSFSDVIEMLLDSDVLNSEKLMNVLSARLMRVAEQVKQMHTKEIGQKLWFAFAQSPCNKMGIHYYEADFSMYDPRRNIVWFGAGVNQ